MDPGQDNNQKQQLVERLKDATNVLVTVSTSPSVDQLAACIGLTLFLNHLDKHATAVFSGGVPSTLQFLQPDKTIEHNTDSLRDFIISLDKSKADKLRYKVEENVVKIFITPYRTSISDKDLDFSQGDFNVDVVIALGVAQREQLDQAIIAHGRILHDATVVTVSAGNHTSTLGTINWQDPTASSLCEMLVSVTEALKGNALDNQMATAFLTGIVAETERFSNQKTSPKVMTMAAQLMGAGANQQLIATELAQAEVIPEVGAPGAGGEVSHEEAPAAKKADGSLSIAHDDSEGQSKPTDSGLQSVQTFEDKEGAAPTAAGEGAEPTPEGEPAVDDGHPSIITHYEPPKAPDTAKLEKALADLEKSEVGGEGAEIPGTEVKPAVPEGGEAAPAQVIEPAANAKPDDAASKPAPATKADKKAEKKAAKKAEQAKKAEKDSEVVAPQAPPELYLPPTPPAPPVAPQGEGQKELEVPAITPIKTEEPLKDIKNQLPPATILPERQHRHILQAESQPGQPGQPENSELLMSGSEEGYDPDSLTAPSNTTLLTSADTEPSKLEAPAIPLMSHGGNHKTVAPVSADMQPAPPEPEPEPEPEPVPPPPAKPLPPPPPPADEISALNLPGLQGLTTDAAPVMPTLPPPPTPLPAPSPTPAPSLAPTPAPPDVLPAPVLPAPTAQAVPAPVTPPVPEVPAVSTPVSPTETAAAILPDLDSLRQQIDSLQFDESRPKPAASLNALPVDLEIVSSTPDTTTGVVPAPSLPVADAPAVPDFMMPGAGADTPQAQPAYSPAPAPAPEPIMSPAPEPALVGALPSAASTGAEFTDVDDGPPAPPVPPPLTTV